MNAQNREKSAELKARLDFCRGEDRHECSLINNRMIWMLTCHAFLFAGYFVLHAENKNFGNLVKLLIASLAFVIAMTVWIAIKQAERVIKRVHRLESLVFAEARAVPELAAYFNGFDLQRQWNDDGQDVQHVLSFVCQTLIPCSFAFIWLILFVAAAQPLFTK